MKRFAAGLFFILLYPALAHGQSACAQLGVDCSHPNTSGSSDRSSQPNAEDRSIDRNSDSVDAHNAGVAAYRRGDYATALRRFQQALAILPHDRATLSAIAMTRGAMAEKLGMAAWDRDDPAAALTYFQEAFAYYPFKVWRDNIALAQGRLQTLQESRRHQQQITQSISRLSDAATSVPSGTSTAPSPLDFKTADKGTQVNMEVRVGLFGTTRTPSNPNLGERSPDAAVPTHSTAGQLSSASKSSKDAAAAETMERVKDLSNCQFDKDACRTPDAIEIARPAEQTPGAMELASHLPAEALKNQEIQNSLAWYDKLEKGKAEGAREIAGIQKQIDGGNGDAAVLNARKAAVENSIQQMQVDQGRAKEQIKKRLLDLHHPWIETPQQSGPDSGSPPATHSKR